MRIIIAFLLLFITGCQSSEGKTSTPVNPFNIVALFTEADDQKKYKIKKGDIISFSLRVKNDDDYYWSVVRMDGDFEVLSDTRNGNIQTMVVQLNSSGVLEIEYNEFESDGAKDLSRLTMEFLL